MLRIRSAAALAGRFIAAHRPAVYTNQLHDNHAILHHEPPFEYSSQLDEVATVPHTPVMASEAVEWLNPLDCAVIVDATFGAGGHSRRLLDANPALTVVACDRDPVAHRAAVALEREAQYRGRIVPVLARFSELPDRLDELGYGPSSVDGFLIDAGCSSMQFDCADRGFSLARDGPLDMRMDGERYPNSITAADVVARASEGDLYAILKAYGDEKQARRIARALVEARYSFRPLTGTAELAALVEAACEETVPRLDALGRRAHVATKTFQALRVFVNDEVNELNYAMLVAKRHLKIGGRLVAITFHSLEDTVVKRHVEGNLLADGETASALPMRYSSHLGGDTLCVDGRVVHAARDATLQLQPLFAGVRVPRLEEVEENPRSRSAKLRAVARIR